MLPILMRMMLWTPELPIDLRHLLSVLKFNFSKANYFKDICIFKH